MASFVLASRGLDCPVKRRAAICPYPRRTRTVEMVLVTEDRVNTWIKWVARTRCPFLRRRGNEAIDMMVDLANLISQRGQKLDLSGHMRCRGEKKRYLTVREVMEIVRDDFEKRNYYITGRLSFPVYCDDCLFNSPDPDLPMKGVKRYVDAAAFIFDGATSCLDLLDIKVIDDRTIQADWRLEGRIRLPWKPSIKAFLGRTTFSLDEEGLICRHEEQWSITALDAFLSLCWKGIGPPAAAPAADLLVRRNESLESNPPRRQSKCPFSRLLRGLNLIST